MNSKKTNTLLATIQTNLGNMEFALFEEKAPKAVLNFTSLAKSNYYNEIIFHRVIKDFIIQGGDPTGTGRGGESFFGRPFEDECHPDLIHKFGTLSMANAGPNTNGSQFFVFSGEAAPWLDGVHTIFGQLTKGKEILQKINTTPVNDADKPVQDVIIQSITITTK